MIKLPQNKSSCGGVLKNFSNHMFAKIYRNKNKNKKILATLSEASEYQQKKLKYDVATTENATNNEQQQ